MMSRNNWQNFIWWCTHQNIWCIPH